MSLILNSQGTYINSETGKYKFLINYETSEYLTIDISSSAVITISGKNKVAINTNFDTESNRFAKLYKVKNNVFCNYLALIERYNNTGTMYVIIPLLINEGNIHLPSIYSDYDNFFLYKAGYFGFWNSIAPEIDGTLSTEAGITACTIGFDGNNIYSIVFANNNEKLFLMIMNGKAPSGTILTIFNGETSLSDTYKIYYLKNDYTIFDKNNNKINDNGFIHFIAPYIGHEQIAVFIYKNYFIILTREENGIHICYAELDGNNIIDFGEITGLDYRGGFLGFSIVDDKYLYLNYSKDWTYSNSVDCYYVLKDSTVVDFKYTIRFLNYDGSELEVKQVEEGITPAYTGQTPTREGYTFTGWTPSLAPATQDQDYTATFEAMKYQIRFLNGTLVLQDTMVSYGEIPTYTGEEPTKEGYVFLGWTPTPYPANKNQTYTPRFRINSFTIRFLGENDEVLQEETLEYGATPVYKGATPTKEHYDFAGWTPDIYPVNRNQDYKVKFTEHYYTITLLNEDGSLFATVKALFGNPLDNLPTPEPEQEGYVFDKWLPDIQAVSGDATYTASFRIATFTIRFLNYDGSVLQSEVLEYGATPVYKEDTPIKVGSTFLGWKPDIYSVNKDQDYTAQFSVATHNLVFKANGETLWQKTYQGELTKIEVNTLVNLTLSFTDNKGKYSKQILDFENATNISGFTINGQNYAVNEAHNVSYDSDIEANLTFYSTQHYRIRWSVDGTFQTEYSQIVESGTIPTYTGPTPSKEGHTFLGWTPTPYPADKNQDYAAILRSNNAFTITVRDSKNKRLNQAPDNNHDFGSDLIISKLRFKQSRIIPYGQTISVFFNENETADLLVSYDPEYNVEVNSVVIGSTTHFITSDDDEMNLLIPLQSSFEMIFYTKAPYHIRFLDEDGTLLYQTYVGSNEIPRYVGELPSKDENYIFNGWTPTLYPADKNQDYTATYRKITFAINLYQNSSENNRIDKTEYLTSVGEIEGYLRQETNIINPTIVIEYNKVIDFNYIYISTFNRYYFVNGVSSVRTNLWRIELSVDVLMTYKDTILNYECFVARNENTYDAYIEDKYLPLKYEKEIEYIEEWSSTDTNSFFKGYTAIITTIASNADLPEEEKIEITTPFEDGNGKVAMTSTFETGSSGFKVVQFIPEQNAYGKVIDRIVQEVVGDDKVASYILSFIVFPIWNPAIYSQVNYESGTKFYYGKKSIDMTEIVDTGVTPVCVLKGDTIAPIYMRSFAVPQHYNSFLDYEPYSTYELWLPFHGWVKLNATLVVGKLLSVYYIIQPDSTKGTILVKNVTDGVVALEVPCDIGVEIAVNTTNAQEIANRKNAAAVGLGTSTAIGVAAGVLGMATLNPVLMLGGVASMLGGVSNFVQQTTDLRTEGKGSVNSGNEGLYSDRIIKLKITRTPLAVDDLTKYAKYIGRPLQTNVKLNTLTGYTIVGGVHVENLPQATESEKQEIEKILRQGFII